MKQAAAAVALCVFLAALGGCGEGGTQAHGSQPIVSLEEGESAEDYALTENQQAEIGQMILQNAAAIQEAYSAPTDITVYDLTRFLYGRMQLDGIADGFQRSPDEETVQVPIERVREYASTYFNLGEESIRIDFITQQYFDGQYVTIPNPDKLEAGLPYQQQLVGIDVRGSRITATVKISSGGVDFQRWNYTLRVRKDGTVYFVSMLKRPVEFGLYAVNGAGAVFTSLMDIPVNAYTIDSFQFKPFLENMAVTISNERSLRIGLLDLNTFKSDRYITLEGEALGGGDYTVEPVGENLFVYQKDKVTVLDKDLLTVQEIAYPPELLAACDESTLAFSLSPGFDVMAFSDQKGLNFFNMQTDSVRQVIAHPEQARGAPKTVWQPRGFSGETGLLLLEATNKRGFSGFITCDDRGSYRTVGISGDSSTLYSVHADRLMVYSPASVRREALLPGTYAEYNTVSTTYRTLMTDFPVPGEGEQLEGRTLLSDGYVYRANTLVVGEDLVNSCSIQAFNKQPDRSQSEEYKTLDFGYVDKNGRLSLRAAGSGDRVVAACKGTFIHAIVII